MVKYASLKIYIEESGYSFFLLVIPLVIHLIIFNAWPHCTFCNTTFCNMEGALTPDNNRFLFYRFWAIHFGILSVQEGNSLFKFNFKANFFHQFNLDLVSHLAASRTMVGVCDRCLLAQHHWTQHSSILQRTWRVVFPPHLEIERCKASLIFFYTKRYYLPVALCRIKELVWNQDGKN